jgi:hypothetical protein
MLYKQSSLEILLMSIGPMAQKPHRQQSGQLVANALLQALAAGMANRRL